MRRRDRTVDGAGRKMDDSKLYYLQDARGYVGDFMSFWKPEGTGYTCSLEEAGLYVGAKARKHRDTDVPWLPEDLAPAIVKVVDSELVKRKAGGS